jgi:hypothetical protein
VFRLREGEVSWEAVSKFWRVKVFWDVVDPYDRDDEIFVFSGAGLARAFVAFVGGVTFCVAFMCV